MLGRNFLLKFLQISAFLFFYSIVEHAFASATYLHNMYSAVSVGEAGAGGAALANDASTLYSNPAGMTRLSKPQIVISGTDVNTTVQFKGNSTWSAAGFEPYSQSGTANAGANRLLPEIYIAFPASKVANLGLSITAPFGLGTYYPADSILRYSAITSELKVIDISPNIAFKIHDKWSVGAGLDIDKFNIRLSAKAGLPALTTALDSISRNEPAGWAYGWHAGLLYELNIDTRIGYAYRSQVSCDIVGHSSLTGNLVNVLTSGTTDTVTNHEVQTNFILPPIHTLSAYHHFYKNWAIEASLSYVQWSTLNENLVIKNIASYPTPLTAVLPQHFKNTWVLASGLNYQVSTSTLLRSGIFWDQSPIPNATSRTVNLPDSNRTGLSVGSHHKVTSELSFDLGYTHLFFSSAAINTNTIIGVQTSNANGKYQNHADLFAAQLTWDIG